ncbi:MAG TPA: hypothetical protein VHH15_01770, partial [Actinophytocola sp.]|nr:hypothetical protein [Actinophytocola sp.]
MSHRLLAGLLTLALTVPALTACGSADPAGPGEPQHLTVWLMRDSASAAFVTEFEAEFEGAHPDLRLDVQIQEWDGITEKVT